jgi:hypothetical protein
LGTLGLRPNRAEEIEAGYKGFIDGQPELAKRLVGGLRSHPDLALMLARVMPRVGTGATGPPKGARGSETMTATTNQMTEAVANIEVALVALGTAYGSYEAAAPLRKPPGRPATDLARRGCR